MKYFLDTNLLIYAVDADNPVRQTRARAVLERLTNSQDLPVISTQVLQEFYVTATRKLGLPPLVVKDLMRPLQKMEVVLADAELVDEAIDCSIVNQLSFWDALIVTAAERANCKRLLSEDLNANQTIRGVTIENPFL